MRVHVCVRESESASSVRAHQRLNHGSRKPQTLKDTRTVRTSLVPDVGTP